MAKSKPNTTTKSTVSQSQETAREAASNAAYLGSILRYADVGLTRREECISNAFPAVFCNAQTMLMGAELGSRDYTNMPPIDRTGYLLINGMLVPFPFIEQVKKVTEGTKISYGAVVPAERIVGAEFLRTLTGNERQVIGQVILHLIERGDVAINFSASQAPGGLGVLKGT